MAELFDLKVGALIEYFAAEYPSVRLRDLNEDYGSFDVVLSGFFSKWFGAYYGANNVVELRNSIRELPLFPIDNDITFMLFSWGEELYGDGGFRDPAGAAEDFMSVFARDAFGFWDENGETSAVSVMWSVAVDCLPVEKRRFLALCVYYLFTKNYMVASPKLNEYLKTVESFFHIRSYLLLGGDYPSEFALEDVDFANLKSLFSVGELGVVKALTAGGAVAQSVAREDLEGDIVNTLTEEELRKKTKRKKYTRRVPLE